MDPDSTSIFWYFFLLLILIFINAFFAASEMAIVSINDLKLKKWVEGGHKKAKLIQKMLEVPTSFLATIQIGVTLSGFLASAIAADAFAERITAYFQFLPLAPNAINAVAIFSITVILSFVTLIFGELVPKRLAIHHPEKIGFATAGVLSIIYKIFKPLVLLLSWATDKVLHMFGVREDLDANKMTEEEIKTMVEEGNESGLFELAQKNMINNIFEFDDKAISEVMTHRKDCVFIEADQSLDEVIDIALEQGYSRLPVFEDDLDNILGVLYVKDLLSLVYENEERKKNFKIKNYMRKVHYAPDSMRCIDLFTKFTEEHIHMAVVVDEYGGTYGIVTMEDLLESIVGSMQDEYDNEDVEVTQIDLNTYDFAGWATVDAVERLFEIEIPEGEYESDTIGGLLIEVLGRIPSPEEKPTVTIEGVDFTILESNYKTIDRIRAYKPPEVNEDDDDQ